MQKKTHPKPFTLSEIAKTPLKMLQFLENNLSKKILVVGDVGLDRYTIGRVERISPEAPVPIVHVQEEKQKLGLAANVADNIRALSGTAFLVSFVGKDRAGEDFRKLLKKRDIASEYLIEDPLRRTTVKERIVSDAQQLVRIDYEDPHPIHPKIEKKLLQNLEYLIPKMDAIVLEDYAKGLLTPSLCQKIFQLAKKFQKIVAVDPNRKTPLSHYYGATLLTPNQKEASILSGIEISDTDSLHAAGKVLLKKTNAHFVILTRGKDGIAIFSKKSSKIQLIPTYAREVFDVSGAGDTVISVCILAFVAHAPIEIASFLGNVAAGIEVGKRGTATITLNEMRRALETCPLPVFL